MAVRTRSVMRSAFRNGAFQRGLQVILIAFFAATASAGRAGPGDKARRPGFRGRARQDLHQSRRHLGVEPRPRARRLGHRHRRERPRADHRLSDGGGACRRDRHQRRPHLAGDRRRLRPRDRLRPAAHARAAEHQAARLRQARRRSRSRTRRWSRATAAPPWCCRSASPAAASSPEAGSIWSRARSSRARRIRPGAGPR